MASGAEIVDSDISNVSAWLEAQGVKADASLVVRLTKMAAKYKQALDRHHTSVSVFNGGVVDDRKACGKCGDLWTES